MKRWLTTILAIACCSAIVRADVTVVQTTTIEGGMAAMSGGGANTSSTLTTRIKGLKSRTDLEGGPIQMVAISDVAAKQVIVLNVAQKTATISSPTAPPAGAAAAAGAIDSTITPTGKSQVIDGVKCNEYKIATSINLSDVAAGQGQMPPEAAAMMQGMKMVMTGSIWVAKDVPGAADYFAFQKAVAAADMVAMMGRASGLSFPGMEKMTKAMGSLDGLSYLTEILMNVEGTGQMADMMKQMGAMKITTRVSSIKTEALGDDLFKVPEGFTIVKK